MTGNDRRILAAATALAVVGVVALGAGALSGDDAAPVAAAGTTAPTTPAIEIAATSTSTTPTAPTSSTSTTNTTTTTSSTSTTSTTSTTTTAHERDPADVRCVALTEIAEQLGYDLGEIEPHDLGDLIGDDGQIDDIVATLLALHQCVATDMGELMQLGIDPDAVCAWLPELQADVRSELDDWTDAHGVVFDLSELLDHINAETCDP